MNIGLAVLWSILAGLIYGGTSWLINPEVTHVSVGCTAFVVALLYELDLVKPRP